METVIGKANAYDSIYGTLASIGCDHEAWKKAASWAKAAGIGEETTPVSGRKSTSENKTLRCPPQSAATILSNCRSPEGGVHIPGFSEARGKGMKKIKNMKSTPQE